MRGRREPTVKTLQHSVGMREAAHCTRAGKRKEGSCALEEEEEEDAEGGKPGGRRLLVVVFLSYGETAMAHQEMKADDVGRKKKRRRGKDAGGSDGSDGCSVSGPSHLRF